jgi:integrase
VAKLTKTLVAGLSPDPKGKDAFAWDSETRGFGVRVKPSGVASFLVQYRTVEGRTRRLVIGRIGTITPDQARRLAREKLLEVSKGADPSTERQAHRGALTVGEVCDAYMQAARAGLVVTRFRREKRPSTIGFDEGRIVRHIKPLIGGRIANRTTRQDVQRMADAIAADKTAGTFVGKPRGKAVVTGGAGTAARVVGLLGGIWTWAERRGLVTGVNPAHGVETAASQTKDRILSPVELRALGNALRAREEDQPQAVAAVRLLALTGLRRQEACGLRWSEIDEAGSCLRLESTKTGRSRRAVGTAAIKTLQAIPRRASEYVFPAQRASGPADLKKRIEDLFSLAGLADARSQELRRTFSTIASDEGYSDATIAELLGHAQRGVTARHYIRRPDDALVAAADRVAKRIAAALDGFEHDARLVPIRIRASTP